MVDPSPQERADQAFRMRLDADDDWELFLVETSGGPTDGRRAVLVEFRGLVPAAGYLPGRAAVCMPIEEMEAFLAGAQSWLEQKLEERGW